MTTRLLHGVTFRYVENVDEVLAIALLPEAEPDTPAAKTQPAEARPEPIPVRAEKRPSRPAGSTVDGRR
jgi:hypothetical protein